MLIEELGSGDGIYIQDRDDDIIELSENEIEELRQYLNRRAGKE